MGCGGRLLDNFFLVSQSTNRSYLFNWYFNPEPLFNSFHSGNQSDFSSVDILIPGCATSCVPTHRLAALQTCDYGPVLRPILNHGNVAMVTECGVDASNAVHLQCGDSM